MSEEGTAGGDAAWIRVATPLSVDDLAVFIRDVERLLRINSMYEFLEWRRSDGDQHFIRVRNHATGHTFDAVFRIEPQGDGMRIVYEFGLKTATEFRAEAPGVAETGPDGQAVCRSVLVVTDDYSGTPEAERHARETEIDKSLVWWGHDLRRYLRHWSRWSRVAPWRWYMRRVWQPMKPTARRITFILLVLTAFEIALGALALALYALE